MHAPNVDLILKALNPSDMVLDVGGWACPFNRADVVIDSQPYETRGFYATVGGPGSQGGAQEHFHSQTWIQRDICSHDPWPFCDKQFDYVICSHTLEDVRDPLWVCAEMVRVGKRGYLEVPSRVAETCRGWESDRFAGLSHHRWLIDVDASQRSIVFLMKYHMIHSHWRFSLPASFLRSLSDAQRVQWLFWDGGFAYSERQLHGLDVIAAELEDYVARIHPYPRWQVRVKRAAEFVNHSIARTWLKFAG